MGDETASSGTSIKKRSRSSFKWNGIDSSAFGIIVLQQPSFIIPKERYSSVTIPGRMGRISVNEGGYVYDNMQLSCTCMIENGDVEGLLGSICLWLNGSGTVRFSSRPGGYYNARIANQIPFDKVVRGNTHRTFTITFDCEPFFYMDEGEIYTKYDSTTVTLENPGNFFAEPLIRVRLNSSASLAGDGDLIVTSKSGSTVSTTKLLYDGLFKASGGRRVANVFIDSASKMAHSYRGKNLSPMISGEWPILPSDGECTVSLNWYGAIKIAVQPRWRCIG